MIESILEFDWPLDRMKIIIADGMSDDGTRKELDRWQQQFPELITILDNRKFVIPSALNLCIREAESDFLIRLDVHCKYPVNYVTALIECALSTGADNVGGAFAAHPGNNSTIASVICTAVSHPFGNGPAHHRLTHEQATKTDTVPFGCFRQDLFDRIGYFDENMIRNEDEEFNGRIVQNNGDIFVLPSLRFTYYTRTNIKDLLQQYYNYGYFKPLVWRKLGRLVSFRQLIPPIFALYVALLAFMVALNLTDTVLVWIPIILYLALSILVSLNANGAHQSVVRLTLLVVIFGSIHLSYGLGYLVGLVDFVLFHREKIVVEKYIKKLSRSV